MGRTSWHYKIWTYETFTLILVSEDRHQEYRSICMQTSTKKQKWTIFNSSFRNIDRIILQKEERMRMWNKGNHIAYSSRIQCINSHCSNRHIRCNTSISILSLMCCPRMFQWLWQNPQFRKHTTQHEEPNKIWIMGQHLFILIVAVQVHRLVGS